MAAHDLGSKEVFTFKARDICYFTKANLSTTTDNDP